jgi:imidazolonepropionase-like amidohydrolase
VLVRRVEVWDGDQPVGRCDVELTDGLVTAVRPAADAPSGPQRSGLALIPGLIDTHVHLVGDASRSGSDFYTWPLVTSPEEKVLHGLAHAQRALAAGVTTLRDLTSGAAEVAIARATELGLVTGPRVVTHAMVSMTAGHHDLFTPAAVRERRATADGPDASRALVRTYARTGVDGIKVATSGGVLSIGDRNTWRNHTDDQLAGIVDEAHALGMLVAAHAHTAEGVRRALDHGVDSLEHATLIDEEAARTAAARGVTVAPTLLINDALAQARVPVAPAVQAKAAELVARRDAALASAARAGVRFVLGTDANGFHVDFGDELDELARMATVLGLSAPDALRSATSWAAGAIARSTTLGRITEGYAADAVLVRGRPWEDLADLARDNVVAVIVRGRVVSGAVPPELLG